MNSKNSVLRSGSPLLELTYSVPRVPFASLLIEENPFVPYLLIAYWLTTSSSVRKDKRPKDGTILVLTTLAGLPQRPKSPRSKEEFCMTVDLGKNPLTEFERLEIWRHIHIRQSRGNHA